MIPEPHLVPLPTGSRITAIYPRPDLADAYAIEVPPGTLRDPAQLARFLFAHEPAWVSGLMGIRDKAVSVFGLKTGRALRSARDQVPRIGIFRVYETHAREVLLGEDDKHLDFRASVLYREPDAASSAPSVVLSTVVRCHNLLGRTYLALITPFHRLVVQGYLRQAARVGWPREA